jgi:drug/metabolite transporter (DMT)-like permease
LEKRGWRESHDFQKRSFTFDIPEKKEMVAEENKDYLDFKAFVILFIITLVWGFNHPSIKYTNQGIAPVFASTLRSVIASICGVIYCLWKKERLFHTDINLFHGCVVGLLFGLEFACLYFGLLYTDAARSIIFMYTSPFIVAVGAHFLLEGDRLSVLKTVGLIVAFTGVLMVFQGRPVSAKPTMFFGDILAIIGALLWAATTLYIKRFMAGNVQPINTFLYQLVFSIPILLVVSLILEPRWIITLTPSIVGCVFFQSVIVAFITYFIWFKLIHTYSVSRLSAFTFLTPIFGVLAGVIFLGEEFTRSLMVGLPMVCAGIFLVNWKRRNIGTGSLARR